MCAPTSSCSIASSNSAAWWLACKFRSAVLLARACGRVAKSLRLRRVWSACALERQRRRGLQVLAGDGGWRRRVESGRCDPFAPCQNSVSYGGPMAGIGGEWRSEGDAKPASVGESDSVRGAGRARTKLSYKALRAAPKTLHSPPKCELELWPAPVSKHQRRHRRRKRIMSNTRIERLVLSLVVDAPAMSPIGSSANALPATAEPMTGQLGRHRRRCTSTMAQAGRGGAGSSGLGAAAAMLAHPWTHRCAAKDRTDAALTAVELGIPAQRRGADPDVGHRRVCPRPAHGAGPFASA